MIDIIFSLLIPLGIIAFFLCAPLWITSLTKSDEGGNNGFALLRRAFKKFTYSSSLRFLGPAFIFYSVSETLKGEEFIAEVSVGYLLVGLLGTADSGVLTALRTNKKLQKYILISSLIQSGLIVLYVNSILSPAPHFVWVSLVGIFQGIVIIIFSQLTLEQLDRM
ncbi:hypothetical protein EOPP23_20955 [Endozoicomonas sp. OPT23]|uniref:hypothetical protein n=1 Tax=Endozoicomonas sp. OPT23 TaxID=2072845 RepID=UPI00129BDB38|nr:hypothetical protein [Endozoicomonas sp. OPT23]MRI35433.1 hypothetical protein [Endozoicomonas sp. OPT23]